MPLETRKRAATSRASIIEKRKKKRKVPKGEKGGGRDKNSAARFCLKKRVERALEGSTSQCKGRNHEEKRSEGIKGGSCYLPPARTTSRGTAKFLLRTRRKKSEEGGKEGGGGTFFSAERASSRKLGRKVRLSRRKRERKMTFLLPSLPCR